MDEIPADVCLRNYFVDISILLVYFRSSVTRYGFVVASKDVVEVVDDLRSFACKAHGFILFVFLTHGNLWCRGGS